MASSVLEEAATIVEALEAAGNGLAVHWSEQEWNSGLVMASLPPPAPRRSRRWFRRSR